MISNINEFNKEKYSAELEEFFGEKVGLFEDGNASEALGKWMIRHR